METEKRRFFVIGYPRSRTAWLSVLLNGDGVRCEHEASGGRGAEGIRDAFDSWSEDVVGTCEPGLIFHVEELLALYPDAHWVVIRRDPREALASIMADRPNEAHSWREKWPLVLAAFNRALDLLPAESSRLFDYGAVDMNLGEIHEWCTGRPLAHAKHDSLKGLRITQIPTRTLPVSEDSYRSAVDMVIKKGFDLTGLTVRRFEVARDGLLFVEWGSRTHDDGGALIPLLPPLGVVVEDSEGPAAMLFCRESFGVPAADLEFSVTRPGLCLGATSRAMAFAVAACIELAGRLVVPQAHYSVFRVTCSPAMGRFVKRLGFEPHGRNDCQKFVYLKN